MPLAEGPSARELASNRCVFVVSSLAGIVLRLPRVSYPAEASAATRDAKCLGAGRERPQGLSRPFSSCRMWSVSARSAPVRFGCGYRGCNVSACSTRSNAEGRGHRVVRGGNQLPRPARSLASVNSLPISMRSQTARDVEKPGIFCGRKPFALVTTGFDQIQEHPAAVPIRICAKQGAVDGEVRRAACGTQAL